MSTGYPAVRTGSDHLRRWNSRGANELQDSYFGFYVGICGGFQKYSPMWRICLKYYARSPYLRKSDYFCDAKLLARDINDRPLIRAYSARQSVP